MTREDILKAFQQLRNDIDSDNWLFVGTINPQMVDMAIKVLEQPESCKDTISRQAAIAVADFTDYTGLPVEDVKKVTDEVVKGLKQLPFAQPESFEDKLKKIADALSEKMSYMNTCPNERDIILGYLGIERPSENHCNSDCWKEECESYHYETKKQPEPCDLCSNLEKGDTLYQSSDWDGGIGFDYIRDIQFCPKCGRRLEG